MKIKQIIIILFIVLSAIPMILLGAANMYFYNDRLENVMENDLRNTADIQMQAIEFFLTERKADAADIVQTPFIHDLLDSVNQPDNLTPTVDFINQILLLHVQHNPYIESATILNTDFIVAACSMPSAVGDRSVLENVERKHLTSELLFTPVIETPREGGRSHTIAAMMEIRHESLLEGYLVLELNLDFFDELRDSAKVYNNGTIYIIDGNSALISAGDTVSARESFILDEEERADYHRAWAARDKTGSSGILRYTARGDSYLTYYSRFDNINWMILASVNIDEVLQTRRGYLELAALITGVLACLLLAVNSIVKRYLGRPIHNMIQTFEKIEQTQDYSIRMDNVSNNEIGTVSANINRLLEGMERYVQKERRIKNHLKSKAERDPLTGLYNKEAFAALLKRELENAKQQKASLACLFLDIDDFKGFNTDHGHIGGDKVLCFIAEALLSQIGDLACRQGGDEFTVCIPDASDKDRVKRMLEDLQASLRHGLRLNEKDGLVSVNCSIGLVFSDENTEAADELIAKADIAMYTIKNHAKNGYRIWDEQLTRQDGIS